MTAFIDPLVACTLAALTAVAFYAARFKPLAFVASTIRVRPAAKSPAIAPRATEPSMPQPLDTASQMERLFAIISDCERLASRAARCHATARAELDQADYHLTALIAADPLLQRSMRVGHLAPAVPRLEAVSKTALRLAA